MDRGSERVKRESERNECARGKVKRHTIVVHLALDFGSIFILNHYMLCSSHSHRCTTTLCVLGASVLSCALAAILCFHRAKECFVITTLDVVVVVVVCLTLPLCVRV